MVPEGPPKAARHFSGGWLRHRRSRAVGTVEPDPLIRQPKTYLACSAVRVAKRVLISDSLGSFWIIGSITHPSP
jgi:hypothetical protein